MSKTRDYLWKCFYGADLTWWGNNAQAYESVYELKTNKDSADYTALINFINVLNNAPASGFACAIQDVFDVELFLRNMALEILIGQWDGYPKGTSDDFIEQVKERIESSKQ